MSQRGEPEAPTHTGVAAAEASVVRAEVAFAASLHDASLVGRETAQRVVSVLRPVLIGVGLVTGALIAVRLLRGPSRAQGSAFRATAVNPIWSELARSGALALTTVVARRLGERWLGASNGRRVARVSSGLAVLFILLGHAGVAGAQNKLSFDGEAAFPSSSASKTGWGLGLRAGHEWDLLLLSLTPEIGGSYHAFGGSPDARTFSGVAGARVGLGFILEPSVFTHFGVGHFGYDTAAGAVSHTSLTYDFGAALDLTVLPVIDLGAHVDYVRILGDSVANFSFIAVGAHITFKLGK